MRQRVMIAMALACKPQLLIADEPTTARRHGRRRSSNCCAIAARLGDGDSLITHDLGVVAGVADRVAVMYAGRTSKRLPSSACCATTASLHGRIRFRAASRSSGHDTPIEARCRSRALPRGCAFEPRAPSPKLLRARAARADGQPEPAAPDSARLPRHPEVRWPGFCQQRTHSICWRSTETRDERCRIAMRSGCVRRPRRCGSTDCEALPASKIARSRAGPCSCGDGVPPDIALARRCPVESRAAARAPSGAVCLSRGAECRSHRLRGL